MKTDHVTIWEEADAQRDCLEHLKTHEGRRRHTFDIGTNEDPLLISDPFLADEAKLLSSKTVRQLAHKTQVFTFPKNTLVRTRRTHVDEVVAISVITADLLGLNTNLVRAAAIGHDVGHVPFGHAGEAWMAAHMGRHDFCHEVMGPIVTQKIERKGSGLNLTFETLDAMQRHSGKRASPTMTPEAWVLRYCDKIAYLFADYNDIFVRMQFPASNGELTTLVSEFGSNQRERVSTAIAALVIESATVGHVSFEHSTFGEKFQRIRELMYAVYPRITQQDVANTLGPVLDFLGNLQIGDPYLLLALMTDHDVVALATQPMKDISVLHGMAIMEIIPHLESIGHIDLCDPDLDW